MTVCGSLATSVILGDSYGIHQTRHNGCDLNNNKCPVVKVRKDFKTLRRTTPSSVGQVRNLFLQVQITPKNLCRVNRVLRVPRLSNSVLSFITSDLNY